MAYQQPPPGHPQQQQQYYAPPPGPPPPGGPPQQYAPPPGGPQGYSSPPPQGYASPPPGGPPPPNQATRPNYSSPPPQHQQQQQQQHGGFAPPPAAAGATPNSSDTGSFPGGTYAITHRDTNAVLNVTLQQGAAVKSKTGAMIHMSGTIQLSGKVKLSMKKLLTGGELTESTYIGPGRLGVGPTLFGDIITLLVDGRQSWTIGKDAYLASTTEVTKDVKAQGLSKAMFSGEDLFVYRVGGQGIMWLTSFGAVDRIDLQPGEQHIVDNGHLVAWSCDYRIERAGSGGLGGLKTGEGLVCRFTGPGSVYVQTRNRDEFGNYIRAHAATGGGGGGGGVTSLLF